MRKIIVAGLIILVFSSCYRYQYLTLSSESIPLNMNNEFVAESDTLRITYNFHGKNGPVNIAIYNKSGHALQVDWKRSSLIFGERPVAFYQQNLRVTGEISNATVSSNSGQSINAIIQQQEGIEFIPPHSVIYRSGFFAAHNFFNLKPFKVADGRIMVKGFPNKMKKVAFVKDNSPLNFRTYFTFMTEGKTPGSFVVGHDFYLSELIETKAEPAYVWPEKAAKGNTFFLDGSTTPGKVVGTVVGAGFVIAVVIVAFNQ